MNIIESLNRAESTLVDTGSTSARLDTEVLLAHILNCERIDLYTERERELNTRDLKTFEEYIKRRAQYEPVAYITGTKEFWSIPVKVTKDVLIPRPETELLVEKVLSLIDDKNHTIRILDLCTGSGNIPMALAKELPNAQIVMTDISKKAIALAKENTTFASDRITALTGNLFEALHLNAPHTTHHAPRIFDIITANPPYGRPSDSHLFSREVVDHEPPSAVFGGVSGLDFIKRIIENGHTNLKPGGWMVFEIGIDQGEEIRKLVSSNNSYDLIEIDKDLAGIERIVGVRKKWKN